MENTQVTLRGNDDKALTKEQIALITRTVAEGATHDELAMFLHVAKKAGLDPFSRQIYFIKRGGKATVQTSIDGYRLAAARSGAYAGSEDAVLTANLSTPKFPRKATVTVYRMVANQRCPFTATARWDEYCPQKNDFMWKKMPTTMIAKCAEALALRKAFPAELSGIYTNAEMDQAGGEPVTHPKVESLPEPPKNVACAHPSEKMKDQICGVCMRDFSSESPKKFPYKVESVDLKKTVSSPIIPEEEVTVEEIVADLPPDMGGGSKAAEQMKEGMAKAKTTV